MTATRDPVGDAADRSIGQLLSDMSAQTSRLVRNEMRPAQQGFQQSAKRAGIGGGLIGIAGLLLIFAYAADVAVIIAALALVLPVWAAVLIAAAVLLAVAGIAALINQQERGSARVPSPVQKSAQPDMSAVRPPAMAGAAERPVRQLSGRRSDVRPIVQHSIPDTGWCTVSSPRLASNPSAGYPPSVSAPVAQRPVVGPPGPAWAHTNGFVPRSLSSDGRSGGQRGGADRRLCPVWRPLRFLADWCDAGGCQCVVGLVRNTRRNLPI
jgi:hypothetical protein